MTLSELRQAHESGKLPKHDFIAEAHRRHAVLFEYPEYLKKTDISSIEITPDGVVMKFGTSGVRMLCDPTDKRIAPIETLNFYQYEPAELSLILPLIPAGGTVLDIGGNFGWYSLQIARTIPGVRIFAFEPIPQTYDYFCRNLRLNSVTNVEALNMGLSNKPGELVFYFCKDSSGSASSANIGDRADATKITCRVETLDHFVSQRKLKVDFVKCDVEGAELLVFQGALETLAAQKPAILSEMLRKWSAKFNYHPNEIIQLLGKIGYRCHEIHEGRLRPLAVMTDETTATNFVFLHPDRHGDVLRQVSTNT